MLCFTRPDLLELRLRLVWWSAVSASSIFYLRCTEVYTTLLLAFGCVLKIKHPHPSVHVYLRLIINRSRALATSQRCSHSYCHDYGCVFISLINGDKRVYIYVYYVLHTLRHTCVLRGAGALRRGDKGHMRVSSRHDLYDITHHTHPPTSYVNDMRRAPLTQMYRSYIIINFIITFACGRLLSSTSTCVIMEIITCEWPAQMGIAIIFVH